MRAAILKKCALVVSVVALAGVASRVWATGSYALWGGQTKSLGTTFDVSSVTYDTDNRQISATVYYQDDHGIVNSSGRNIFAITRSDLSGANVFHSMGSPGTANVPLNRVTWTVSSWPVPVGETFSGFKIVGVYTSSVPGLPRGMTRVLQAWEEP